MFLVIFNKFIENILILGMSKHFDRFFSIQFLKKSCEILFYKFIYKCILSFHSSPNVQISKFPVAWNVLISLMSIKAYQMNLYFINVSSFFLPFDYKVKYSPKNIFWPYCIFKTFVLMVSQFKNLLFNLTSTILQ